MIMLALAPSSIAVVSSDHRGATPIPPVATGRSASSLHRSRSKQAFNALRQQTASVEIPIAVDARPRHTSRGFLLWRFAYAGPRCSPRHHHGAGIRKPSQKRTCGSKVDSMSAYGATGLSAAIAVRRSECRRLCQTRRQCIGLRDLPMHWSLADLPSVEHRPPSAIVSHRGQLLDAVAHICSCLSVALVERSHFDARSTCSGSLPDLRAHIRMPAHIQLCRAHRSQAVGVGCSRCDIASGRQVGSVRCPSRAATSRMRHR